MNWRPSASLANLTTRARLLRAAREYFTASGALEVETPTLSAAAVSDVHLASVTAVVMGRPRYLHTSPEYAMKRLLAHGCGDVWQICRVFRDEERGRWHNPEFTLIEWYRLGIDHHALMSDVENLIRTVLGPIRVLPASQRQTYGEVVRQHAGIDPFTDSLERLLQCLADRQVDVPAAVRGERDRLLDLIMSTLVIPRLGSGGLTFVYDYPASQAALARIHGAVAARFEAFLDGLELANGFHELGDAAEQRRRFEQDLTHHAATGRSSAPVDEHLLQALAHGLPDCSGVALGFDRLVMCAVGARHIDEVLAFGFERA
jgi:lysyl-tRNA synthetase class 2